MSQVKVEDSDLYIIFKEISDDSVLQTYRLDNGAEFDFYNDELIQLILPNFETQLNRGSLLGLDIDLVNVDFDDAKLSLAIKIMNDTITIHLDCSSIMHKL